MTKKRVAPKASPGTVKEPSLPDGRARTVPRLFLIATAFLAGTAVMVLELAGNRILAPWFGNSLYTWTGLIGVVLISLSGGYYLGGYLADKRPDYVLLAHLLAASSLLTLLVPVFQSGLADFLPTLDVVWGPVLATLLLLAAPGCLLAAVSPFTVRLMSQLSDDQHVGLSAGSVAMAATFGSVAGTFSAGFWLIPHLHLSTIFYSTGAILAGLAVAGYVLFAGRLRKNWGLLCLLAALYACVGFAALASVEKPSPGLVEEVNSFYHRIRVVESSDEHGHRARYLFLDNTLEGGQVPGSKEMALSYQRFWEMSRVVAPDLKRAAFLGGGGFAMPEALLDAFPQAEADVVEIDPAVIDVGRKYFRLGDYPRLNPVAGDARRFLQSTGQSYDFIFGDAYHGIRNIPAHLTTVEFFELVKSRLTDRGAYMMNIISAAEGDQSVLFRAIFRTVSEVFPEAQVFLTDPAHPTSFQNVILLAAMRPMPMESLSARARELGGDLPRLFAGPYRPKPSDLAPGPILRDARNPVEYLVAKGLTTL